MAPRLLRALVASCVLGATLAASAFGSVLYVGDSLGVGTSPYLRDRLPDTEIEVDAKTGRPSGAGVEVLASLLSPAHDVVVFDLGTNDDPAAPEALAQNLARAGELAGERCLVVATLNRPPLNGVPVNGLNRAVTSFAASNPAVSLVDWHAAVAADSGLLTDGVHPDTEGYAVRAGLFADAIEACGGFDAGGAPAGGVQPDLDDLPPQASAGSNEDGAAASPEPDRRGEPRTDPRLRALAVELARAIATGAEFG